MLVNTPWSSNDITYYNVDKWGHLLHEGYRLTSATISRPSNEISCCLVITEWCQLPNSRSHNDDNHRAITEWDLPLQGRYNLASCCFQRWSWRRRPCQWCASHRWQRRCSRNLESLIWKPFSGRHRPPTTSVTASFKQKASLTSKTRTVKWDFKQHTFFHAHN